MSVLFIHLAAQLRGIEDELKTSLYSSPSQLADSVSSALGEIETSLEGVRGVRVLSIERAERRTILVELEKAAMCARRAVADPGPFRERHARDTIAHVRRARAVLALGE